MGDMGWSPMRQLDGGGVLSPGEWMMRDRGRDVAIITQVEIRGFKQSLFLSVSWSAVSSERGLIGYFPTLQMAAAVTWEAYSLARARTLSDPHKPH